MGSKRKGNNGTTSRNLRSASAALGSVWALLGVIGTSLSVLSLFLRLVNLEIGQLLIEAISAYRWVVRAIFIPLDVVGLELPTWLKDVAIIWFIAGGSTFRTYYAIARNIPREELGGHFIYREGNRLAYFVDRTPRWAVMILSLSAWPFVMHRLFSEPLVYWNKLENGEWNPYGGRIYMRADVGGYRREVRNGTARFLVFDTRRVFAFQLIAIVAIVLAFLLLNASSLSGDAAIITDRLL